MEDDADYRSQSNCSIFSVLTGEVVDSAYGVDVRSDSDF
jgi:hypothetical protein